MKRLNIGLAILTASANLLAATGVRAAGLATNSKAAANFYKVTTKVSRKELKDRISAIATAKRKGGRVDGCSKTECEHTLNVALNGPSKDGQHSHLEFPATISITEGDLKEVLKEFEKADKAPTHQSRRDDDGGELVCDSSVCVATKLITEPVHVQIAMQVEQHPDLGQVILQGFLNSFGSALFRHR